MKLPDQVKLFSWLSRLVEWLRCVLKVKDEK